MSEKSHVLPVTRDLDESLVWKEFAAPLLGDLQSNVLTICEYGFTEMVNNVIDHSDANRMILSVKRDENKIHLFVSDDGVGIFRKIQRAFGLSSQHDAALELAKGKLTTDPERHAGEGIFFTARMFDWVQVLSGEINFQFKAGRDDWLLENAVEPGTGTVVEMDIDPNSNRTTREVFDRFALGQGDFDFDTTRLGVRLLGLESGPLVSRSQAKRLLARLEQFRTVILDFEGVEDVGPAFADEIFRVFLNAYPQVRVIPVNANENVDRMILHALSRNGRSQKEG